MTSAQIGQQADRKRLKDAIVYACARCHRGVVVKFDWNDRFLKREGWRFLPVGDPNGNAHCKRCLWPGARKAGGRRPRKRRRW